MYSTLKKEMEQRLEGEARATLLTELDTVREYLEHNERRGLQSCLSPLPTGKCFGIVEYVQIIKRQI